jgi:phosphoadenosine phosphosulfate reductase
MAQALKLVERPEMPLIDVDAVNSELAEASPEAVLEWAYHTFGNELVLTSSFGAESALMIHLATRVIPRVRVVFLDTGYLFPETYQFAEELRRRFELDLRVYAPAMSAARQEALYGQLWLGTPRDLERYQQLNKIEPMDRALRELAPLAWLAGLRGNQTAFRAGLRKVERKDGVYKVHPILSFSEEDVFHYMRANDLPYHPLYKRGYRSIGDVHSTAPTREGEDPRAGRRLGEHSECGLHTPRVATDESLKSSSL